MSYGLIQVLSALRLSLSVVGGYAVITCNFVEEIGSKVKCVVLVLAKKSRIVVHEEL